MTLFKQTLHKLATEAGLSFGINGADPTNEEEYNNVVEWRSNKKISWADLHSELYKLQRKEEYPSIGDQLDDLFHNGAFSEEMQAKIQAIKDKYPKE